MDQNPGIPQVPSDQGQVLPIQPTPPVPPQAAAPVLSAPAPAKKNLKLYGGIAAILLLVIVFGKSFLFKGAITPADAPFIQNFSGPEKCTDAISQDACISEITEGACAWNDQDGDRIQSCNPAIPEPSLTCYKQNGRQNCEDLTNNGRRNCAWDADYGKCRFQTGTPPPTQCSATDPASCTGDDQCEWDEATLDCKNKTTTFTGCGSITTETSCDDNTGRDPNSVCRWDATLTPPQCIPIEPPPVPCSATDPASCTGDDKCVWQDNTCHLITANYITLNFVQPIEDALVPFNDLENIQTRVNTYLRNNNPADNDGIWDATNFLNNLSQNTIPNINTLGTTVNDLADNLSNQLNAMPTSFDQDFISNQTNFITIVRNTVSEAKTSGSLAEYQSKIDDAGADIHEATEIAGAACLAKNTVDPAPNPPFAFDDRELTCAQPAADGDEPDGEDQPEQIEELTEANQAELARCETVKNQAIAWINENLANAYDIKSEGELTNLNSVSYFSTKFSEENCPLTMDLLTELADAVDDGINNFKTACTENKGVFTDGDAIPSVGCAIKYGEAPENVHPFTKTSEITAYAATCTNLNNEKLAWIDSNVNSLYEKITEDHKNGNEIKQQEILAGLKAEYLTEECPTEIAFLDSLKTRYETGVADFKKSCTDNGGAFDDEAARLECGMDNKKFVSKEIFVAYADCKLKRGSWEWNNSAQACQNPLEERLQQLQNQISSSQSNSNTLVSEIDRLRRELEAERTAAQTRTVTAGSGSSAGGGSSGGGSSGGGSGGSATPSPSPTPAPTPAPATPPAAAVVEVAAVSGGAAKEEKAKKKKKKGETATSAAESGKDAQKAAAAGDGEVVNIPDAAASASATTEKTAEQIAAEKRAAAGEGSASTSAAAAGSQGQTSAAAASGKASAGSAAGATAAATGISGASGAAKTTASQAAATAETKKMHGAFIQGRTGPGILLYPLGIAAANGLLLLIKRRKRKK